MINSILLYDNEDKELGDFFNLCANEFQRLASCYSFRELVLEHHSGNSEREDLEKSIMKYNQREFLFVSFLHGKRDAMLISNSEVISLKNSYFLTNAFCYTFSCHCGADLAEKIISDKAHVFWGYKSDAFCYLQFDEDFMKLTLSGLIHFLEKDTIAVAYNKVKEEYTNQIDSLYPSNFLVASALRHNRDALVVHGRDDFSINDFRA